MHPTEQRTRRTQAERRASTRAALLAAARELIAEHGYADAPRELIVERAGVTPGALHHHFATKRDLFYAVVEEIEQELVEGIFAAVDATQAAGGDVFAQVRAACHSYLEACARPDVVRIVVLDAPSVLGPAACRELDQRYALGIVDLGFDRLVEAGVPRERLTPALAQLIMGAVDAAGTMVASADDLVAALVEAGAALDVLLDGVLTR